MVSQSKTPKAAAARRRKPEEGRSYFVQAVGKALDILELVTRSPEPLSLAQITRSVDQSKSSAFRLLCTLEKKGLVERLPGELFSAAGAHNGSIPNQLLSRLVRTADPRLRELAREFRESVSLALLFENHIGVVTAIDSPQKIRMGNVLGGIIPPHASSLGKCIAAQQPYAVRDHLLRTYGIVAFTPHTITDEARLDEEYRRVKEQGYAVDREESTLGGLCFAAPVWTGPGQSVAAVSLSFPKDHLEDEERAIQAVCRAAEKISAALAAA